MYFYATWTDLWGFKSDVINYAATLAVDKQSPLAYMNRVLSSWFEKGVKTLQEAKTANYTAPNIAVTKHSYSDADLSAALKTVESAVAKQEQIAARDAAFYEAYARDNTLTRAQFNAQFK